MTTLSRRTLLGATVASAIACLAGTALAADPTRIAVANFGEHPQLAAAVEGFKAALTDAGMVEGKDVFYSVSHTNFDATLVPQMITKLQAEKPALMYTITTPVSQIAKKALSGSGIPIVFGAVTDPVAAKLVPSWDAGDAGMTGASDLQDIAAILKFAKQLLPDAKTIGLPYNPGEANDVALLGIVKKEAAAAGLGVAEVAVDNVNDIQQRIVALKGKADFVYNPASNLLQPATPAVAAAARQIGIPVINASETAVNDGIVLASFAVNYHQVGLNAGKLAVQILKGADPKTLAPSKPRYEDHAAVISQRVMDAMGMKLPAALADCKCVVK